MRAKDKYCRSFGREVRKPKAFRLLSSFSYPSTSLFFKLLVVVERLLSDGFSGTLCRGTESARRWIDQHCHLTVYRHRQQRSTYSLRRAWLRSETKAKHDTSSAKTARIRAIGEGQAHPSLGQGSSSHESRRACLPLQLQIQQAGPLPWCGSLPCHSPARTAGTCCDDKRAYIRWLSRMTG